MRLFETAVILLSIASCFLAFTPQRTPRFLIILTVLFMLIQVFWEGFRWQMSFAYVVLILSMLMMLKASRPAKWLRFTGASIGIVLTLISFLTAFYLPVFELPVPSGAYAIGSTYRHLTDTSRFEGFTKAPDDHRQLMLKVWYPVSEANGVSENYLLPVEKEGFAAKYGLPTPLMNYLDLVKTHTYPDQPMAAGRFPVIVFSPGYYTPANSYYGFIEEWVSQGYVVISLNHTYESPGSLLADGTKAFFDVEYMLNNAWSDEMGKAYAGFKEAKDEQARMKGASAMVAAYPPTINVIRWVEDIQFVIDQLHSDVLPLQQLKNHMNLDQLVVVGHSHGGAAALESMIGNDRIKGAANLDGAQWGNVIDHDFKKPAMFVRSELFPLSEDINQYIFSRQDPSVFYNIMLKGAGHSNFSDMPFLVRLRPLNEAGGVDPHQAMKTVNQLVMRFVDECISQRKGEVMKLVKSGPELESILLLELQ